MGHRSKNPAFSMVRKIAEDGRVTPQPNRIPHPSRCIGCFPRSRTTPRQPEAPPSHKRERHEPGPPSAAFSYPSQTVIHRDKISAHDPVPQPRPKSPPTRQTPPQPHGSRCMRSSRAKHTDRPLGIEPDNRTTRAPNAPAVHVPFHTPPPIPRQSETGARAARLLGAQGAAGAVAATDGALARRRSPAVARARRPHHGHLPSSSSCSSV